MSEERKSFRTALFGGFNRRDVVQYIQSFATEQNARIAKLNADLEFEREARIAAEETVTEVAASSSATGSETDRLTQLLSERDVALAEQTARLEALEAEHTALLEQLEQARPAASAYETLKEKAAVIELDAHSRAHQIIAEAEYAASALRAECESWLRRVRGSYEQLRNNVEATVFHSTNELERTHNALTCAMASFREHDAVLAKLSEQAPGADSEK